MTRSPTIMVGSIAPDETSNARNPARGNNRVSLQKEAFNASGTSRRSHQREPGIDPWLGVRNACHPAITNSPTVTKINKYIPTDDLGRRSGQYSKAKRPYAQKNLIPARVFPSNTCPIPGKTEETAAATTREILGW